MNDPITQFVLDFQDDVKILGEDFHKNQKRKDGSSYHYHLIRTAMNGKEIAGLEGVPYDLKLTRALLYHDAAEDNPKVTWEVLTKILGPEAVEWIKPVTKIHPPNWHNFSPLERSKWTARHYAALAQAPIQSRIIKISDRIDNLNDLKNGDAGFQRHYLVDTLMLITALQGSIKPGTMEYFEGIFWDAVEGNFNLLKGG